MQFLGLIGLVGSRIRIDPSKQLDVKFYGGNYEVANIFSFKVNLNQT